MTDITLSSVPAADLDRIGRIRKGLIARRRREVRFRLYGILAVSLAVGFVGLLVATLLQKGLPAFWQAEIALDVTYDPAIVKVPPAPIAADAASPADYERQSLDWQRKVTLVNWNKVLETAVRAKVPDLADITANDIQAVVDANARFVLRDAFVADPSLLGRTVPMSLLGSANADVWMKGNIDRTLGDDRQQLSAGARKLIDRLVADGVTTQTFASHIFTNADSRSAPASAGLAGAFVGSLYMMLIVIFLAVPIGVASAIYLEEFAPRNRLTDIIEVNINNLAAVPSIVFGLLGAAVFINYLHLPISAPLVGGLVLTLMTLPTIIIATRSSLKAVPPSLRQAALGLGASKTQAVFHHVLPVTIPGILTATIIGVAHALGETAPLLLIGMKAFVASIPPSPLDQSTALPVQIYLWQGNENRNFFEARTSAAIIVLLGLMILLNGIAIFLRSRFERRG